MGLSRRPDPFAAEPIVPHAGQQKGDSDVDTVCRLRVASRFALRTSIALVMMIGAFAATGEQASAATRVGGLDIQGWCESKYFTWSINYVTVVKAALDGHNVDGWRCRVATGKVYPNTGWGSNATYEHVVDGYVYSVDMDDVCRRQYGSRAFARYSNWNDPYSWSCYR